MRRPRPRLAIASACVALLGCSTTSPAVSFDAPARRYQANDYPKVLGRWTRHARIIKELDTPLKVHATFFSPDYRRAYLARYVEMFALPSEKAQALTAKLEKEWQESLPVVLVAATHDHSWNDFHRKNSVWRLSLIDDRGRQVEVRTIERARRTTATLKALYPHLDDFYQLYRLRFPRLASDGQPLLGPATKRIALQIAGPLGLAKLVWRLK